MWSYWFIWLKSCTLGACQIEIRPENGRNATGFGSARPKQEILPETQNTPWLARNTHFAHLGAARACQSVDIWVHMAKTRHSGRIFGRKTARKRPSRVGGWAFLFLIILYPFYRIFARRAACHFIIISLRPPCPALNVLIRSRVF